MVYTGDMNVRKLDIELIHFFRRISEPAARISLFIVFFWFGILKLFDLSPAGPMVEALFNKTVPFITFPTFIVLFGLFEMIIGILFLVRGTERIVIPLLALHMVTTLMPLVFIPAMTWAQFLVPTMEGQYIIKNMALIAVAIGIAAHLHPVPRRHHN